MPNSSSPAPSLPTSSPTYQFAYLPVRLPTSSPTWLVHYILHKITILPTFQAQIISPAGLGLDDKVCRIRPI